MREILIKGKPFFDYLFKFLSSVQLNESYNEDFMPFFRIESEYFIDLPGKNRQNLRPLLPARHLSHFRKIIFKPYSREFQTKEKLLKTGMTRISELL